MRLHLNRKNNCDPILSDVNIDTCRQDILNNPQIDETGSCTVLLHSAPSLLQSAPFCSISESFECLYCNKKYRYNRNLNKHLKTCKAKLEQKEADDRTYALVEKLNQQIESQQKQIDAMKNEKQHIINNNTTNTNNVQINIQLDKNRLNYKDTNYNIIGENDIRYAISKTGKCIQEIVSATHFNKKHPENQNIYISCLKSAVAMMFEEQRWNAHAWNDIADRVINDNTVTLQSWIELNKDNHPNLAEKFKIFMERKEKDCEMFLSNLKRELKMVLYNNRKLVHSEEMITLLHSLEYE